MLDTMPRQKKAEAEPTKTVSFRLPISLLERMQNVADQEDRNLTAQVARALREWLAQHGSKPKP